MITEERQRAIYEWRYPELKGHPKWTLYTSEFDEEYPEAPLTCTITVCWPMGESPIRWGVDPLYVYHNGVLVPNIQFFVDECVPQLKAERVTVRFGFAGDNWWYVDPLDDDENAYGNSDPYAATAEYLEAK